MIASIQADGGGDLPEPIHEALRAATDRRKMGLRSGHTAVIILIGDSPIHPSARKAAFDLASQFARRSRNNTINVIDTGGDIIFDGHRPKAIDNRDKIRPDLAEIAKLGNGSAYLLTNADRFWRDIIILVFGQRFQEDVDAIIDKYLNNQ